MSDPAPLAAPATAPRAPADAAYVHVPFCRHRCGYCDFTLVARRDDLITRYLAALETELNGLGRPQPVTTLFVGGGTPTHLSPQDLQSLLGLLARRLPLRPGGEFSVEANPSGLDDERLNVLAAAGVNRLSLGVQSFDSRHLATLERDHTPDDACQVIARARRFIPNVSLDLIFGVPGQTPDDWTATLTSAVALQPQHISTYGLTWERGTTFWSRRLRGALAPVDEEAERTMYADAMDRLAIAGFEQYELSNFARPGFRCRHNQVYWRGAGYYGFGPGAASYLDGVRRNNHRSTTTWLQRLESGRSGVQDEEQLDVEPRAREAIMLGLRQIDGVELDEFLARFGATPESLEPTIFAQDLQQGWCEVANGRWRLTRAGRFIADRVMSGYL